MTGALVLLGVLIVVGIILRLLHKHDAPDAPTAPEPPRQASHGAFCCGMHVVCEKGLPLDDKIVYYDDEELDRYAGRGADDYDNDAVEEFRDILLTLRPEDIAGWAHSLDLRNITLPAGVRDEMLMIVAEARAFADNPVKP